MKALSLFGIVPLAIHVAGKYKFDKDCDYQDTRDLYVRGHNYKEERPCKRKHDHQEVLISHGEFIGKVFDICKAKYNKAKESMSEERAEVIINTLDLLYERCNKRLYELAAVTATVLHNTSYLRVFEAPGIEKYRGRGIFQISTKDNYELLSKAARFYNQGAYVKWPERLGRFDYCTVEDSILFWLCISHDKKLKISLYDVLRLTNPSEYRILSKSKEYSVEQVNAACKRFRNREKIYKILLSMMYCNRNPCNMK